MQIVTRAEWRAQWPKSSTELELPVSQVFFALTNSWPCNYQTTCAAECRRLQHSDRITHQDIRYNFIVGGDGHVYEGRGWESIPNLGHGYADCEEYSIYIGCIGKNTSRRNEVVFKVLHEFLSVGVEMKYITEDYNMEFISR